MSKNRTSIFLIPKNVAFIIMALLYKFFDNRAYLLREARVLLVRSIRAKVECKCILVSFSPTLCQFLFKMPRKNGLHIDRSS